MRLAVEVTACTTLRTGIGYYAEHLVDALLETRRAGDELVLLSNRSPAPELAARWAPYLRVGGPGVRVVWMQLSVPHILADSGADVALFPNYVVPLASPCPTISIVHDLAIVRTPQHFTLRKRAFMRAMLRPSIAAASLVGTVSQASQEDIVHLLGVPRRRVALFRAAAHPSCRIATPEQVAAVRARHGLSRPYVLTVGTLEPRKNLLMLMRAFERLGAEADGHDLVVVGARGWLDRELLRQIRSPERARRVRWLGYVPESDLSALYTGADLFVLASSLEGFGLPVLEAMACGAPVVASDIPALREIGGDAARFAPANDEAALTAVMAEALRDREALKAKRDARCALADEFRWTRTAEAVWASARSVAPARVRGTTRRVLTKGPRELPPPLHPPPSSLSASEWALLATVVYADVFDSPLPLEKASTSSFGVALDETEVRRLATGRGLEGLVTLHASGFLVLAGREHLVDQMPRRAAVTRGLLGRKHATLSRLAGLPFVRSIVVSGGLVLDNPGERPDVDLFVVAARGHVYTAYTMLFLATKLTGNRRVICPNYLVDESELAIAYHRDLFTAHELQAARPFSGPSVYAALCRENDDWIRRFFPAFAPRAPLDSIARRPPIAQKVGEALVGSGWLEALLRAAWRVRLRRRSSASTCADVVLADGVLKLHLSDYRPRVLQHLSERLDSLRVAIDGARAAHPNPDRTAP